MFPYGFISNSSGYCFSIRSTHLSRFTSQTELEPSRLKRIELPGCSGVDAAWNHLLAPMQDVRTDEELQRNCAAAAVEPSEQAFTHIKGPRRTTSILLGKRIKEPAPLVASCLCLHAWMTTLTPNERRNALRAPTRKTAISV